MQQPGRIFIQHAAVGYRVFPCSQGQLVRQAFHGKNGMAEAYRAPVVYRNGPYRRIQLYTLMGDRFYMGRRVHAFYREPVDAVNNGRFLKGAAGHNGLAYTHLFPGNRHTGCIQPNPEPVQEGRPVHAATDVVFAGPHGFYKPAGGFGHFHSFAHKIRAGNVPPSKRAAQEHGVQPHFIHRQAGDLRSCALVVRLCLRAGPYLAFVRA